MHGQGKLTILHDIIRGDVLVLQAKLHCRSLGKEGKKTGNQTGQKRKRERMLKHHSLLLSDKNAKRTSFGIASTYAVSIVWHGFLRSSNKHFSAFQGNCQLRHVVLISEVLIKIEMRYVF